MTEPRGLHLLHRQRRRRRASSSLEQHLLENDDDVEEVEQSCSLRLAEDTTFQEEICLPPSLRLVPPCHQGRRHRHHHHHRRIDTSFIHPALEYEILPLELLGDINHNNINNCNNNQDGLLCLQQVAAAAQEEERIRHCEYERQRHLLPKQQDHHHSHQEEENCPSSPRQRRSKSKSIKLFFSFVFLILFGSANSVALKLQAIPMYNYPNFLILFVNFMYIPICFAYILPVAHYGWFNQAIPAFEHWNISISHHRPFIIMGFLDCIASCMQILSAVYLPGPLVVLLPQAAIPMSMLLSKWLLHERFHHCQVIGAVVVVLGILVVLEPVVTQRLAPDYYCQALNMDNDCSICKVENTQNSCLSHVFNDDDDDNDALSVLQQQWRQSTSSTGMADETNDDKPSNNLLCDWVPFEAAPRQEEFLMFVWSLVLIASCIPLTLSTVYKQMALGNYDNNRNDDIRQGRQNRPPLDPIFLSGWISVYQFLFSLPLAIPAGLVSSPPVLPADLMQNLWNGLRCYAVGMSFVDTGCHVDDLCSSSSSSTTSTVASQHYYGGGSATFYVNLSLVINVGYTIAMILVVKYGSTALLFLALTIMIPISHLTFSMGFLPLATTTLHASDIVSLIVIMAGIILYRFSDGMATCSFSKDVDDNDNDVVDDVDDAANNRGTGGANSEPATVGVVNDGVVLENDDNNTNINNNGQAVGGEGKEDPLLLLTQPLQWRIASV